MRTIGESSILLQCADVPNDAEAATKTAPAKLKDDALPPGGNVFHRDAGTRRSGLLRGRTREQETGASPSHGVPGSMFIAMVRRERISFHAKRSRQENLLTNPGQPKCCACSAAGRV